MYGGMKQQIYLFTIKKYTFLQSSLKALIFACVTGDGVGANPVCAASLTFSSLNTRFPSILVAMATYFVYSDSPSLR